MHKDPVAAKEYQHQHYLANKELYKERARASRITQKIANEEWLRNYLLTHPCVDCGTTDIRVLQFDHRDGEQKFKNVGQLKTSRGKLEAEVAKCDVRCANCHMIRTAEQFGWSRLWDAL